ncbi:MAG TPA: hypothetical protein VF701_04855, partial [Thermoanaerobaculia bacterium]
GWRFEGLALMGSSRRMVDLAASGGETVSERQIYNGWATVGLILSRFGYSVTPNQGTAGCRD